MRVFRHCRKVRDACSWQATNFWKNMSQTQGGAILSLHMSQAFDRLPRQHFYEGFQQSDIPEELQLLFMHWLHEARYHITHIVEFPQVSPPPGVSAKVAKPHQCPYCEFSTQFKSQLTKYMHRVHQTVYTTKSFDMLRDALAGFPGSTVCPLQQDLHCLCRPS